MTATKVGRLLNAPNLCPEPGTNDWRRLLAKPERHWHPERSAALLATSWETAKGLPPPVCAVLEASGQLAFRSLDLLLALPEHQVHLPPHGHPSQTDVWALARGDDGLLSIAVEGKVTESFGPTLRTIRHGSPGQRSRLRSLCETLGLIDPPDTIRYQLLHRAVSAVLEARRFTAAHAVLLIQSFSSKDHGFADFEAFAHRLEATPIRNGVVIANLPGPPHLWLAWVSMHLDTHRQTEWPTLEARPSKRVDRSALAHRSCPT